MSAIAAVIGLLFVLISGYVASFYYPGGFGYAQASNDGHASPWGIVLLAVLMVAGIFSSFVFEKAKQEGRGVTAVGPALRSIFNDFQLVAALFVSPLIFNSIYALTNQNPETIGDFLLAYQNGFFWQTVLAGVASNFTGHRTRRPRAPG